jgi:branched-chain amino acid transport system permease protein
VNFAQGDFLMVGGYIAYLFNRQLGLPIGVTLGLTAIIMGLIGIGFQFIVYWPLRKSWDITVVISTLGASIALRELARIIWGPAPLAVDSFKEGSAKIAGASINWQFIFIITVAAILMGLIYYLLERTYLGHIMQATAQDQYAASLVGIPVLIAIAFTFAISILITGVGGLLLGPVFFISTTMGANIGLDGFAAVILGGFGSVQGAILGGIIVGLAQIFAGAYISTTYNTAIVFLVVIIILILRPQGLFGEKVAEKV